LSSAQADANVNPAQKMSKSLIVLVCGLAISASAAEDALRRQAETSLKRAVQFFRKEVAVQGTYLWQYSEDLSKREGESEATSTQGWVQPPGTPAVGLAFLAAWEATGDPFYLEAARETAHGLVRGQLRSGGWTYVIDFSAEGRRKTAYRDSGTNNGRNVTTLDDDTTQSALRFLMRTDRALRFQNGSIRDSIEYGLDALLKAQYPNGAWPQGFERPPDPAAFPAKKASYPETWPRTWPGSERYWLRYTLNDNSLATTIETLLEARRIYREAAADPKFQQLAERCRGAAQKAGDFLLLAQMPEPQPGWAQQYDFDMHPAWARKFEPPSITGGESRGALQMLLMVYRETGERRFLEPIPPALEYFRRSRLSDGRLARFYELRSNKPLYFTKDYVLTYKDDDMPTHYAFKVPDWTGAIEREYERVRKLNPDERGSTEVAPVREVNSKLVADVKSIISTLDDKGRWVERGGLRYHRSKDSIDRVIRCATFNNNVELLSRYLAATRP
jgi:hypothetical protein